MSSIPSPDPPPSTSGPRLWPGLLLVAVQWLFRFVLPALGLLSVGTGILSGLVGGVLVLAWWCLFSRLPVVERVAGAVVFVGLLVAGRPLLHPSIAGGMMGLMFAIMAVPLLSLGLVVAAATRGRSATLAGRLATIGGLLALPVVALALVRTAGMTGEAASDLAWRFSPTAEERLLASEEPVPAAALPGDVGVAGETTWPGFRGEDRDGTVTGTRLGTDWAARAPEEIWRQPVGPGWSSFAVRGSVFYTQEQRGDEELVSCYRLDDGAVVWQHRDPTRFWESNAGAGPRATPTLSGERVLTLGATGVLNALDTATGEVLWTRNAAADTETALPGWGFAGSPLVVDDLVVVGLAGRVAAWDLETGEPLWRGPARPGGYSSPHLTEIDGVRQILHMSGDGVVAVVPESGEVLWTHDWPSRARIVQPGLLGEGDFLLSSGETTGIRRVGVEHSGQAWTATETWSSNRLKPYFSDFVVHGSHAYGFDGRILAALDLADGSRAWKGGRYGHGQMLLLEDQDLLLVLSEEGDLALVAAEPGGFREVAEFPGVVEGKTWNHPVLVGDMLLVRNAVEMAAWRLPTEGPPSGRS